MTTNPAVPTPAAAAVSEPTVRIVPEQPAQMPAKQLKKQRKAERLRFFLGWCQGCQAFGNSF